MARRFDRDSDIEETNSDREVWLIYGDMITFCMALFLMLFVVNYNKQSSDAFYTKMKLHVAGSQQTGTKEISTEDLFVSQVQGWINEHNLKDQTKILVNEQKINIVLDVPVLFRSGEADITPAGRQVLDTIGSILSKVQNPIIIEGHTDDIPITGKFGSNWELSFFRAFNVVKFFMSQYSISPKQLSATGYGEFRPAFPNTSTENRQKNRRIEISIIRVTQKPETLPPITPQKS